MTPYLRDTTLDRPYLTADHAPVAATYKRRWEDFLVEELTAVEPEGDGDHLLLQIEKRGVTTHRAVADIARALGVRPSKIGYAGLKDKRAVASQWLSVEHVESRRALDIELPRIRVLQAHRHRRKLRRGQLRGNRFTIRLRDIDPGRMDDVREVLRILRERGAPNYYGPQRFGTRGDTWRVGLALARDDAEEAVALLAGRPTPYDSPDPRRARSLFDRGRYAEAAETWPRGYEQLVRLCKAMDRTGDPERAIPVLGKRMLRFYASAYRSRLFNAVVAARIDSLDRLLPGELAWKHQNEAIFIVADPAAEQPRADRFEISPTGPLVGRKPRRPEGRALEVEEAALRDAGFDPALVESRALRPLRGVRRPLRVMVSDVQVHTGEDDAGVYLELCFTLPPGCYASVILREVAKDTLHRGTAREYLS